MKPQTAPAQSAGEFCRFAFPPSALIRSPGKTQLISDEPNQARLRRLNQLTHQRLQSEGLYYQPALSPPPVKVQVILYFP